MYPYVLKIVIRHSDPEPRQEGQPESGSPQSNPKTEDLGATLDVLGKSLGFL